MEEVNDTRIGMAKFMTSFFSISVGIPGVWVSYQRRLIVYFDSNSTFVFHGH
jgi:hypothetical protein